MRVSNQNGIVDQGTAPFAGPVASCAANSLLGRQSYGSGTTNDGTRTFLGLIDELQIWKGIPAASVPLGLTQPSTLSIQSILLQGNNVKLIWTTTAGKTNFVQATSGAANGSYNTNFASIAGPIIVGGSGAVTTNYVDTNGATNQPSRYYRVQLVP